MRQITRHPEPRFEHPPESPWQWVRDWIEQAFENEDLIEPSAMNVATLDSSGRPSNRTVLFKGWDGNAPTFYTNKDGRKGQELLADGRASLCFWWDVLDRQIRFEGMARPLDEDANDRYFSSRHRGSQIGTWASDQSRPIASRTDLESKFALAEKRFENAESIPRPPHWGGFALDVHALEIWQGQRNRFHDRILYTSNTDGEWQHERLQP